MIFRGKNCNKDFKHVCHENSRTYFTLEHDISPHFVIFVIEVNYHLQNVF